MTVYFYPQIDSTNIRARNMAEQGAESGSVIWALEQSAGRGRLGKKWSSISGKGLYASFILRPKLDFSEYAKSSLVAAVAVARLLKKDLGVDSAMAQLALKWPNDVFIGDKKIAGILAEAIPPGSCDSAPCIIVGIGLNVFHTPTDFPAEIQSQATSLLIEIGKGFNLEILLEKLRKQLLTCFESFEDGNFPELLDEWRSMDYLFGKKTECVDVHSKVISGVALGPDKNGILLLRDSNGQHHEILSGDLRLAGKRQESR